VCVHVHLLQQLTNDSEVVLTCISQGQVREVVARLAHSAGDASLSTHLLLQSQIGCAVVERHTFEWDLCDGHLDMGTTPEKHSGAPTSHVSIMRSHKITRLADPYTTPVAAYNCPPSPPTHPLTHLAPAAGGWSSTRSLVANSEEEGSQATVYRGLLRLSGCRYTCGQARNICSRSAVLQNSLHL
jgi:hypothetical protein